MIKSEEGPVEDDEDTIWMIKEKVSVETRIDLRS